MCSLKCYFGVYFPSMLRNSENKQQNIQFATRVHTLFSMYTMLADVLAMQSQAISSHSADLFCQWYSGFSIKMVDALMREQHGWHFADYMFKCIFFNDNYCILIQNKLEFVPKHTIDIILVNSLVPNRQRTITWTNADGVSQHHMHHHYGLLGVW